MGEHKSGKWMYITAWLVLALVVVSLSVKGGDALICAPVTFLFLLIYGAVLERLYSVRNQFSFAATQEHREKIRRMVLSIVVLLFLCVGAAFFTGIAVSNGLHPRSPVNALTLPGAFHRN